MKDLKNSIILTFDWFVLFPFKNEYKKEHLLFFIVLDLREPSGNLTQCKACVCNL